MAERPQTNGETPMLDARDAAILAYESLLNRIAEPTPNIPRPREISDETVERMQSYLDSVPPVKKIT